MNSNIGIRERRTSGIPAHAEWTAGLLGVLIGALAGAFVGVFAFAGPIWIVALSAIGAALGVGATLLQKRKSKRDSQLERAIERT